MAERPFEGEDEGSDELGVVEGALLFPALDEPPSGVIDLTIALEDSPSAPEANAA